MPELPEVETIRHDLQQKIINQKIIRVSVRKNNMVIGSITEFKKELMGNKIKKVGRVGKLIILTISNNQFLLIHLRMTGQLIWQDKNNILAGGHGWPKVDQLPNKYSHIIIEFQDGAKLFFNDQRQFGYMKIVNKNDKDKIINRFGIEPLQLNFTWHNFQQLIKNRSVAIKTILLNQQLVAGIGNIYADEICFAAGIRPTRKVNKLTTKELKRIFKQTEIIIKKAIQKRGTTFNDYVDAEGRRGNYLKYLQVYGRTNKPCKKCQTQIKKIRLNGRGTHYCPHCQN